MECSNCGQELPAGARFCWRCGAPTGEPTLRAGEFTDMRPSQPSRYEVCEIDYWRGYMKCDFYARSVPVDSGQEVARSPLFLWLRNIPPQRDGKALAAHTALVQRLLDAGWEPLDTRGPWYAQRFRRAVVDDREDPVFGPASRDGEESAADWPAREARPEAGA